VASGVNVDGVFYSIDTTGDYAHFIDYPRGRFIFESPIDLDAEVTTSYAHRTVQFVNANDEVAQELLFNTLDVNRNDYINAGSGAYHQLAQARRQMPLVALALVERRGFAPYQIGGGQYVFQDVLFHVFTEDEFTRNQLVDILSKQNDKTIWLADRALIKADGGFPHDLDYRGMTVASPMNYVDLLTAFPWEKVRFTNTRSQNVQTINNWLYHAIVRTTFQAVFETI